MEEQNFKNHGMLDPKFHYVLLPGFFLHLVYRVWMLISQGLTLEGVVSVLVAALLLFLTFMVRIYSLKVQDRVIRLEERLRMQSVLPEKMRGRIGELTEKQLIGLRFAPDAELAGLAEKALAGNLDTKAIKSQVQNWRADHFRV